MSTPPAITDGASDADAHVELASLILDTDGVGWDELEVLGKDLFQHCCVAPASTGQIRTHDGLPVYIYSLGFVHACFTAATKARRGIAKDHVDPERIQRLRWIAPVVGGLVRGTQVWRVREWDNGTPPPEKRLYLVRREQYVVWLLPHRDGWKLKTAYRAIGDHIDRYTKRQTLLWSR